MTKIRIRSNLSGHTILLPNAVQLALRGIPRAHYTISAFAFTSVRVIREWMTILAMSTLRPLRSFALTAKSVFSPTHKPKVRGIDAPPVIAEKMIKLRDALAKATRNGLHEPSIERAMNLTCDIPYARLGIPSASKRALPLPTPSHIVDGYLRKDPRDLFDRQVRNREILDFSHLRNLLRRLRDWLGPWGVFVAPPRLAQV